MTYLPARFALAADGHIMATTVSNLIKGGAAAAIAHGRG